MAMIITGDRDMPVAETYFLASKARSKLSKEANRHDHNLRILVSHANLLDNLMDSLAQKRRAGVPTQPTATAKAEPKHTTFAPLPVPDRSTPSTVIYEEDDEPEFEYSDSSDDDYEYYEEEEEDSDSDDDYFSEVQIPFGKKDFRSLPTVDEDPIDEEELMNNNTVPSLSYSSEEEESEEDEGESDELTTASEVSTPQVAAPQEPAKKQDSYPSQEPGFELARETAQVVVVGA